MGNSKVNYVVQREMDYKQLQIEEISRMIKDIKAWQGKLTDITECIQLASKCIHNDVPEIDVNFFKARIKNQRLKDIMKEMTECNDSWIKRRRKLEKQLKVKALKKTNKLAVVITALVLGFVAMCAGRMVGILMSTDNVPVSKVKPAIVQHVKPVVKPITVAKVKTVKPIVVIPQHQEELQGFDSPKWMGELTVQSSNTITTDNFTHGITYIVANNSSHMFKILVVKHKIYRIYILK